MKGADPLVLSRKKSVRYFLDYGGDDFFFTGYSFLRIAMRDAGIPHEYRVRDGGRTWQYWRAKIMHGLWGMGQTCLPAGG